MAQESIPEGLMFHWLDPGNLYHVLMENGNYIYATACRLLEACSWQDSHYQIFAMDAQVSLQLCTSSTASWASCQKALG